MLSDRITQKYANKNVSLLSTSDVKYVGQLFTIDPDEPSIALKNVQCLGTEGRRSGPHAIAASKNIYEFIRFRVMNIKSLNLDEPDQNKDLNKEILEPLRSYAESLHNQSQTQSQQTSNKNANTQRTKSNTTHEESKRKVGGYHAPSNRSPPFYHPAFSPQYDANNQYEYGSTEYYPPLPPSQHQQAHDFMYSPYPYEVEPTANFPQNLIYSQMVSRPRQPQSSYHRRELNVNAPPVGEANSGAPNVVNPVSNEEYYYQQPSSPGYGSYINPQFNNQASRGRNNQGQNYRQYPRNVDNRNNEYFYSPQTNLNYPYQQAQHNDRPGQQNRGNYGKYQNSNNNQQRYYNQRQRQPHAGPNQNRYNKAANDENQIPGTGAYLDRRIQGDDLDLAVIAKDFEFLSLDTQKEKTAHENDDTTAKTIATTNANTDAGSSSNKKEGKDVTTNEEASTETKTKGDNVESNKEQKANEEAKNKGQEQNTEEKTGHAKPAYDKNKSFFDTITTDADIKKQQKQVNLDEQRQSDVETFGNVAGAYRSRHIINQQNDRNANYRRNDRTFNQRKTNFYGSQQQQQQGFDNNYRYNTNNNRRQQYFNNNTQQSFDANNNPQKWVQKRSNF